MQECTMKRTTTTLATVGLGVPAAGAVAVSMARGGGGHFLTDPYSCEPHPSNGSKYLGTDGILPYCL